MLHIILYIVIGICSVLSGALICLQEPKEMGLGSGLSGGTGSSVYRGSTPKNILLKRITVILCIIIFICVVLALIL